MLKNFLIIRCLVLCKFNISNLIWIKFVRQIHIIINRWCSIIESAILWNNINLFRVELLAERTPNLSLIIWMWKLNSNELSEGLWSWIVNDYDRLLLISVLANWTVENCVILSSDAIFKWFSFDSCILFHIIN